MLGRWWGSDLIMVGTPLGSICAATIAAATASFVTVDTAAAVANAAAVASATALATEGAAGAAIAATTVATATRLMLGKG